MPKNVLIFSDGTGQAGGVRPDQRLSNIYKLYRATRPGPDSPINPAEQVAFYDPGLGTISDTGGIHLGIFDKLLSFFGLVTGMGITDNIIDCYAAVLKHYHVGDRICLFGFSRGAYTARSVAAVLQLCGVPLHDATGRPLPTDGPALRKIAREAVIGVYEHKFGSKDDLRIPARNATAESFRKTYGSQGAEPGTSNVAPAFVGVFDTVASLGAPGIRKWLLGGVLAIAVGFVSALTARILQILVGTSFMPMTLILAAGLAGGLAYTLLSARWKARNFDQSLDPHTGYARHARAIDETRADFDVLGWAHSRDVKSEKREHGPWLKQVWFAGNHSDIGGSYPEDESRLSDITLDWMVQEIKATQVPIQWDPSKLEIWPAANGLQHCEVQYSREARLKPTWPSKARKIVSDAPLHPTVLARFALAAVPHCREMLPYRPEALKNHKDVAHYY